MKRIKFIGLDVHAETIAAAVAEQDGEVRSVGVIPNRCESVRKLVKKLGPVEELQFCYEAGPTGYVLYWQLTALVLEMGSGPGTFNFFSIGAEALHVSVRGGGCSCRGASWGPSINEGKRSSVNVRAQESV